MNEIMEKQNPGTSFWLKMTLVICTIFGIKLLFSCTPPAPIEMNYNSVNLQGADNSGQFMKTNISIDTMYTDAVAFNLTLSDTARYFVQNFNSIKKSVAFSHALAYSVDYSYIPVNKIAQIKVVTLFDIDNDTKAGDDISHHILYAMEYGFEMYKNSPKAISAFNGIQSEPRSSVGMVLKKTVKNTKVQLKVTVLLDNGQGISCVSDTITIISPEL